MRLYWQQDGISLFHGDCRDAALLMGPLSGFHAVVTDPPYGDTSLDWDKRCEGWLQRIEPVLFPSASVWVFGSFRYFMEQQKEFQTWRLAQEIIWEKHNGSSFHADRFKRVHEIAVQFYRGPWKEVFKRPVTTPDATARAVRRKKRPTHTGHIEQSHYVSEDGGPRLMRSVIPVRSCHGYAVHPTQKPEGIVEPLLRYSIPDGGSVFDPFAGSGTTLVVAQKLGLRAVGVEAREEYCRLAVQRLTDERKV